MLLVDHCWVTRCLEKFQVSLDDQVSRSKIVDFELVFKAIKINPTKSTWKISGELDVSQNNTVPYLHDHDKTFRIAELYFTL